MKKFLTHILYIALLTAAMDGITSKVQFATDDVDMQNAVLVTGPSGKESFTLADLTYEKTEEMSYNDIVLSFNYKDYELVKDDTDKYVIQRSSYDLISGSGVLGKGAAGFTKKDHGIDIETSRNLWLGSCGNLSSFTIEFRFYPLTLKDESVLFSRIGYFSGQKNGIEIVINECRVSVRLYNVFTDADNRRFKIILNRGRTLEEKKWYHFALSFNRISGKLAKYLNGLEDQVVYVSENGEPYINVSVPSFSCVDQPQARIGYDYCGYIDEFRISYRNVGALKKRTDIAYEVYEKINLCKRDPENREGIVTSPVYSFPSTGTSVTLFKWSENLPEDTFVWMEFRISDHLFRQFNQEIKWYRIENKQKNIYLKKTEGGFLRGKYYQWRAHLVPSPDGKFSPSIYDIELEYRLDPPPGAPLFFEVVKTGDKFIRLRWKKNVEHDLAGYNIYYGVLPDRYDGVIRYIDEKRITNDLNKGDDYITVDITGQVIDENKKRSGSSILKYPVIENNVLYYFTISAYDSYKVDSAYNHESPQAGQIKARPFAGSEIR